MDLADLFKKRLGWTHAVLLIAVASFLWNFGFGMNRAIYNNFLWEELGIEAQQLGFIEGVREFPGLITVILAALTVGITQSVLAGGCILVSALGLALYSLAGGYTDLIWMTLIYSTGFHLLMPIQNALILGHTRPGEKGTRLGQFGSLAAIAALAAMGLVSVTSQWITFRSYFVIAGGVTALGALAMFRLPRPKQIGKIKRRLVFNRDYMSYYILTLLGGSRRHIFLTFGVYNLVQRFDVPVSTIAVLLAIGNLLSVYGRPVMGRFVDTVGERKVLSVSYVVISIVFAGYAFIPWVPVLYVLFCIDALFRFEFVLNIYLDKIAIPEEMAPTLATGTTINHIAGVAVPVVGGLLWDYISPVATFMAGTGVALASLIYLLWLKDKRLDAVQGAGLSVSGD